MGLIREQVEDDETLTGPCESLEAKDRVRGRTKVAIDIELFVVEPVLVLPEEIFDGREVNPRKVPVKEVPVHEDAHPLFKLGVVFIDHTGLFEVLLLRVENFAVVLAAGELIDDGVEIFLVHQGDSARGFGASFLRFRPSRISFRKRSNSIRESCGPGQASG